MNGFDPNGPQFQEGPPQPPLGQPQAPPVVPPPPGGQDPTLGQAGDLSTGNNLVDEYAQALQLTRRMVAPAKMDYQPTPEPVSVFHQILSWGGAGAAARHQQFQHNQLVDAYNRKLELNAADLARDIVNQKHKSLLDNAGLQLRIAQLQLGYDRLANQNFNREQDRAVRDSFGIPTQAQEDEAAARGDVIVPDPRSGSRGFRLQRGQGGGWNLPGRGAAPGSPAAKAGVPTGEGGGGEVVGGAPYAPTTDPAEISRRRDEMAARRKQTTMLDTAATRTRAETAPKVLALLRDARKDMAAAGGQSWGIGPGASRVRAGTTALGFSDPSFMKYQDTVGALTSLLMSMHTGSRSSEMLLKKFEKMMDPTKQSADNMNAAFDMVERYARDVMRLGGKPTADETDAGEASGAPEQPVLGGIGQKPQRKSLTQFLAE